MSEPIRILVVDDEPNHAEAVAESLDRIGYECVIATSGPEGLRHIQQEHFDIVITDLVMDEVDGMAILQQAKEVLPDCEVILITGHATVRSAVTAMQQGAFNYVNKPLDIDELRSLVDKAAQRQKLVRRTAELESRLDEKFGFEGIIGSSPCMLEIIRTAARIAPTSATVLLQGESGTGKELLAKAIHNNSPRKRKRFVALNCASLSEGTLESELFGHEKGAYTGAAFSREGRFEYANGGTLLLDEVGDLPITTQIKLLRVIEEGEIMRVGTNEPIPVNVRLISATHRDLDELVAEGQFREDLYYRLKVVTIRVPPLRQRRSDIPLLANHFIKEFAERHGKEVTSISPEAVRMLTGAEWPGNVRQLRNCVENMVVLATSPVLDTEQIPDEVARAESPAGDAAASLVGRPMDEIEKYYIAETLKLTGGNREEAAKILGIGQRTLYRKIKTYGLS